jgi:single-stranded-DNA-specific exonuclease
MSALPAETSVAPPPALRVLQSFSGRPWVWRARNDEKARRLAEDAKLSLTLAHLLVGRGIDSATVGEYLRPTMRHWLPEPFLLKDMEQAVARTQRALEAPEKIAVFGDYDVDGSTSTAILSGFLESIGVEPRIYIPDRMTEGYGPSARAMTLLKDEGVSLVITVDCGAGAHAALSAAREAGLDVVVLDHHAVELAPPAVAHVNPNQPGDTSSQGHLCAAGVTFLFQVALNRALRQSGYYERKAIAEPDLRLALDLVALATVCDVVPLIGVNRAFVRSGLARLATNERPGIAALARIASAKTPYTAYHLGFMFGPRINAGARVGKCSLGAELLSATDPAAADEIATLLDLHNRERQVIEKEILAHAIDIATAQANAPFLFVSSEGWHSGVVGIVAGRLKDRFAKPAFVAGFEGGWGRGSVRSIPGVDVGAVIRLAHEKGLIDAGGGHAMAAGFSLSATQVDRFHEFLAERFASISVEIAASQVLEIETMVSPSVATPRLIDEMEHAGPFGAGNPEPCLVVPDAQLMLAEIVGHDHVRVRLKGADGARLDGIAFRSATTALGKGLLAARGRLIHAAGRLRADEWQGQRRVQLHLEDAAAADG